MRQGFHPPKPDAGSDEPRALRNHTREIAGALRVAMQGGLNTVLTVELSTGTFTAVEDGRLTYSGAGILDPLNAAAATELATGDVYIAEADRLNGEWTITHPAGATGRLYRLLIIG